MAKRMKSFPEKSGPGFHENSPWSTDIVTLLETASTGTERHEEASEKGSRCGASRYLASRQSYPGRERASKGISIGFTERPLTLIPSLKFSRKAAAGAAQGRRVMH